MSYIGNKMMQRVRSTFDLSSFRLGKRTIIVNENKLKVNIKYLWVANIAGYDDNNYGMSIMDTDKGVFGAFIVFEANLDDNTTLFPIVQIKQDFVFKALTNITLFPHDDDVILGDIMRCSIYILASQMSSHIRFQSSKNLIVQEVENSINLMKSALLDAHSETQRRFIHSYFQDKT